MEATVSCSRSKPLLVLCPSPNRGTWSVTKLLAETPKLRHREAFEEEKQHEARLHDAAWDQRDAFAARKVSGI